MEKKRNQMARVGQTSSDKFKSQDASNKQYPRQRRRDSCQPENSKQQSNKNSTIKSNKNNNNFYYDKRGKKDLQAGTSTCDASGLMDANELNSVFNLGSKKQKSLNHLLNFHYPSSSMDGEMPRSMNQGYHRSFFKKLNFNKEQYLQANCQFIVKADNSTYDYRPFLKGSPDVMVEWNQIEKIIMSSSEEYQCPICLFPPKVGKITKCGHIYCFSCLLHYLSLSDKSWRKCPICFESVYLQDLKSATLKPTHRTYKVGDIIDMELMTREKGTLYVTKACEIKNTNDGTFPKLSDDEIKRAHSKLIMAQPEEILQIITQEIDELQYQLSEEGTDCPESIFVQQGIDVLSIKHQELLKLNDKEAQGQMKVKFEGLGLVEAQESRNEMINECNLSDNDKASVSDSGSPLKQFFYYQAPNAQNVFLHSINSRMLQQEYESLEKAPHKIQGKIVSLESCSMSESLRKRLKYLQHLPVTSVFEVVEIEFDPDFVSHDVVNMFKDEVLHRRKNRQRKERDETKRDKAINEIHNRQMGKMMRQTIPANINIESTSQFPECGSLTEMYATPSTSNSSQHTSSAGPSFATMLTTSTTAKKSEKLWPSLSIGANYPSSPVDNFLTQGISGNKSKITSSQSETISDDEDKTDDELERMTKVPAYKNQLGDCLANALAKTASLKETQKSTGKKPKSKKTLLFASGMNFL